jgi:hypothetical protein
MRRLTTGTRRAESRRRFPGDLFSSDLKEVLMISDANMQIRHIYMNVQHSELLTPSCFGESVGYYDGDELVVDTIGFNDLQR